MRYLLLCCSVLAAVLSHAEDTHGVSDIFPPQSKHVHGSTIVELPNGDLLAAWFHGSGERNANDVLIQGARKPKDASAWGEVFIMADTPNLPDCNPVLYLDANGRLWLFWMAIRANGWQHSVLMYRHTMNLNTPGNPDWDWQGVIFLEPGEDFPEQLKRGFDTLGVDEGMWGEYALPYTRQLIDAAGDKAKRQEGWMTRNLPITLQSGRILLPLYSDGYNLGIAAISDDGGETWRASNAMVGLAGIQPTFAQRKDGTIVAYLRETGTPPSRVQVCESADNGETWTPMRDTDIPNPSASLQVLMLKSGNWAMINNDSEENRKSFALTLSDNEGKSWKFKRHIGVGEAREYPCMIQTADGNIHITYSHTGENGRTIRHSIVNEDWIKRGKRSR